MASISMLLAIAIAIAFLLRIFCQVIFHSFISPLQPVPGPPLAKITSFYLSFINISGNRTKHIHSLHQKYGRVVRVGPNEVSLSDASCIRQIYSSAASYPKAPIYESMTMKPLGLFSMTDEDEHKNRKKVFNHVFTQGNLQECEASILQHAGRLLEAIGQKLGVPLDVVVVFRMLNLDISGANPRTTIIVSHSNSSPIFIGELLLGHSFETLSKPEPPQYVHDIYNLILVMGLQTVCPVVYRLLSLMPLPRLQHVISAPDRISQHGTEALEEYIRRHGRASNRKDLLTKVIALNDYDRKDDVTRKALSDPQIASEITNMILAGTETTSTTFTYLFWELARRKEWQEKLRHELQCHLPLDGSRQVTAYRDLQHLPLLDAVIMETLRVHPAVPGSLPRIVPREGRELGGFWIPGGTTVSMQCYTTHREPSAFLNPDQWDPSRWLDGKSTTEIQKELYMPFGRGPRGCLGKNMAFMILKVITSMLVTSFEVHVADMTQDDDMSMKDHFLAMPKAGKCSLIFNRT